MRGFFNIIFGVVFIIGGLSGGMVMRGTQSGIALAVLGVILLAVGVIRIVHSRR